MQIIMQNVVEIGDFVVMILGRNCHSPWIVRIRLSKGEGLKAKGERLKAKVMAKKWWIFFAISAQIFSRWKARQ